jgi:hypothetical protein
VATAVAEFITGALLDNPHVVGKPLANELAGYHSARRGAYRVVYRIDRAARTAPTSTTSSGPAGWINRSIEVRRLSGCRHMRRALTLRSRLLSIAITAWLSATECAGRRRGRCGDAAS